MDDGVPRDMAIRQRKYTRCMCARVCIGRLFFNLMKTINSTKNINKSKIKLFEEWIVWARARSQDDERTAEHTGSSRTKEVHRKKIRTSLKMYLAFRVWPYCIMQIVHHENIIISLDTLGHLRITWKQTFYCIVLFFWYFFFLFFVFCSF